MRPIIQPTITPHMAAAALFLALVLMWCLSTIFQCRRQATNGISDEEKKREAA